MAFGLVNHAMVKPKRFKIAIVDVFVLFAIPSGMISLLLPAVNAAKFSRGEPQSLAWFTPFAADNGWATYAQLAFVPLFAIVMGAIPVLLLFALKKLFPNLLHDRIVWVHPPKPPVADIIEAVPEKPRIGRPIALVAASALAMGVLLYLASCIRVDRTHRRPNVTWVMITEDWATILAVSAWLISLGSMLLAFVEIERSNRQQNRQHLLLGGMAIFLSALNLLGSCVICGAVYED